MLDPDLGFPIIDDESPTIPTSSSDKPIFDVINPFETDSEFGSDMVDLFSLTDCSDHAANLPSPSDPFWDSSTLETRSINNNNICPDGPPLAGSSDTNTEEPGDVNSGSSNNSPSSEKSNDGGGSIYDDPNSAAEMDPFRRVFSLPLDYQDERCKEFGYIRYAVCSSGDYRDEEKSKAYSFYPIQAYRLRRCSFGKFGTNAPLCTFRGKRWRGGVYRIDQAKNTHPVDSLIF